MLVLLSLTFLVYNINYIFVTFRVHGINHGINPQSIPGPLNFTLLIQFTVKKYRRPIICLLLFQITNVFRNIRMYVVE